MPTRRCIDCGDEKQLRAKVRSKRCHSCAISKYAGRPAHGWVLRTNGYLSRYVRARKNRGEYIYQHRFIMEGILGRKLLTKEHVHHKNGDRQDNRIGNLELISASDHGKEHLTKERAKAMSKLGLKKRWG